MNGKQLKLIRSYAGLSQKDFATLLGVGHTYVSHMESERYPVSERVKLQLAKHFRLTPEFFEAVESYHNFFAK